MDNNHVRESCLTFDNWAKQQLGLYNNWAQQQSLNQQGYDNHTDHIKPCCGGFASPTLEWDGSNGFG